MLANGGPFFASLTSILSPKPLTFTTPPELLPSGWTSTDLWVAPLATALYATLTHAQPFFASLHALLFSFFSPLGLAHVSYIGAQGKLLAVDPDTARSACVLLLGVCFITRTLKTFSTALPANGPETESEKAQMRQRMLSARVAGMFSFLLQLVFIDSL
jgi:hypothetical protein